MKANRRWGVLLSVVLVLALAAGVLALAFACFDVVQSGPASYFEQAVFVDDLSRYAYVMYWKLAQQNEQNLRLTPVDVFFPQAADTLLALQNEGPPDAVSEENQSQQGMIRDFDSAAYAVMSGWYEEMSWRWGAVECLALDAKTGESVGSRKADIAALAAGKPDAQTLGRLQRDYQYYAILSFDAQGRLSVPVCYGAGKDAFERLQDFDMEGVLMAYNADDNLTAMTALLGGTMRQPAGAVVVFAVPAAGLGGTALYQDMIDFDIRYMHQGGLWYVYLGALGLAAALGLGAACVRRWQFAHTRGARLSLEASVAILAAAVFCYDAYVLQTVTLLVRGSLFRGLADAGYSPDVRLWFGSLANFVLLAVILGAVYCAGASLWQIRTLGLRGYLGRGSIVIRACKWAGRQARRLWQWLAQIDWREKSSGDVLKIVAANFLVGAALCCLWFAGIPLLALYSLVLFALLQKSMKELKAQHAVLLQAAQEMANGRLDVQIAGDMGLFNPLREELVKVQDGFNRAVQAETKSQNMKTELITNVSHDLKTPLTAIITYVDLLKREDVTAEERQSYVQTLELKSQRLKRLIDDLFEMSKASSRDISLSVSQVDLAALLRQVETEARDELAAAGVEFRYHFPQEHIVLPLDGDKTSRVFENLVLNVAKYAQPGTRAYVGVEVLDETVRVEIKNVSRYELNFDSAEITERFVRGDISRSSDGSGLGLAIAKSFVEAQGGAFHIETDGDVFKAVVVLRRA